MHPITFQLKRSHLCAVAMGRRIFRGTPGTELAPDFDGVLEMTPARFDILYLIHKYRGPMEHGDLRRRLGLCRSTISKAIKRLVELGLLASGRVLAGSEARRKQAWLTDEGRRRIRRALYVVFTGRPVARHFRAFARRYLERVTKKGLALRIDEELEAIWHKAIHLSEHLGDRADTVYRFRFDSDPF